MTVGGLTCVAGTGMWEGDFESAPNPCVLWRAVTCIMSASEGSLKASVPLALKKEGRAYARHCMRFRRGSGGGILAGLFAAVAAFMLVLSMAVSPSAAQAAPTSFWDVPSGTWYATWVKQAAQAGLMTGMKDSWGNYTGYFEPDSAVTRAQVATVLYRAAGSPSTSASANFKDVYRGEWYYKGIAWCASNGIVTGYTSGAYRGYFLPDAPVSREELATMVYRFAKFSGVRVSNPDPKAFNSTTNWRQVDSWAVDAMKWTAAVDILSGVNNANGTKSLQPYGTATRAQAAKVFVVLTRDVLTGKVTTPTAQCKVTFNSNGGSAVKAQAVKAGAKATKPANPTRAGYTFKGWCTDASLMKMYNFNTVVTSNITLYAKWEKVQAYAILYYDGTLVLQAGGKTDSSRGAYYGRWEWDGKSRPWYNYKENVKAVIVQDALTAEGDSLFEGLSNCLSANVAKLDVSHLRSLRNMFRDCSSLKSIDLSKWDVLNVTSFRSMFYGCESLAGLNLSGWSISRATDLGYLFANCTALASLPVENWDVSNVTQFDSMFEACRAISDLDLSKWDTSSGKDFGYMFRYCSSLRSLNISSWDTRNNDPWKYAFIFTNSMFDGCDYLRQVTFGSLFTLTKELPTGPWYNSNGVKFDRIPYGAEPGTYTRNASSSHALDSETDGPSMATDASTDEGATVEKTVPEGLLYMTVADESAHVDGAEYPELAGRYVGPGVYVTGYEGKETSLELPLTIDGTPVVSANLSCNDANRADMTKLEALTFERIDDAPSSLIQLDVSGNNLATLDISGLDTLVRLNCEGNPIADIAPLQTWAAQEGHEARLPQAQQVVPEQPVTSDNAQAPSESQGPASPDAPAEPAASKTPSTEPAEPSDPTVPSESGQPAEPGQSGEANEPNEPEQPGAAAPSESDQTGDASGADEADQPEGPAGDSESDGAGQKGAASAFDEPADVAAFSEAGEATLAMAA